MIYSGQRCAGRNYNGKRCCTPEAPCDEGEGDCDGPGDGGNNDGHRGCKGDLICGSNNCLQFGAYYHPKVLSSLSLLMIIIITVSRMTAVRGPRACLLPVELELLAM